MLDRQPALFVGHGNPMNALQVNRYTQAWSALASSMPRPKSILAISAHWYIDATRATAMDSPATIHDFGGFPKELYEVAYPAPGDPALAQRIIALLDSVAVEPSMDWGLDHGTWSVLCHMYPLADIPVVQLSIDARRPASWHYELGKKLAPLRDEAVLIVGSGNIVHNLQAYAWGRSDPPPFDWGVRFENTMRKALIARDDTILVNYETLGEDALRSAPTPEHYLPLVYVAALRVAGEEVSFPLEGFDGGSMSMLTVRFG